MNDDKCRCKCKELIDKDICDKEYACYHCNCECECDKSCDLGEYLDYENCKCRKRLVEKLVEECNEKIDEQTSLVKTNSKNCKHNSCILYIAFLHIFSVFFTINIGIATYSIYYKYMNHNKENVSKYDYIYQ